VLSHYEPLGLFLKAVPWREKQKIFTGKIGTNYDYGRQAYCTMRVQVLIPDGFNEGKLSPDAKRTY
jgi:hypothetical protein